MTYKRGLSSVAVILIVAITLAAGTTVGYAFREPIKKAIKGETTQDEIDRAVEEATTGQNKFELEGVATNVDAENDILTVMIKSSTDSIEEMRMSETPITISSKTSITNGNEKDLKISDIPIDSQVHVGGTIADGKLTATKVLIQKDDANANGNAEKTNFAIGGVVKEIGTDQIIVTVSTANKLAKDKKGKDVTIKVAASTEIEKSGLNIALSGIKANDSVQVTGTIEGSVYTAARIEVKVVEEGETLESTSETDDSSSTNGNSSNSNSNNSNKNR